MSRRNITEALQRSNILFFEDLMDSLVGQRNAPRLARSHEWKLHTYPFALWFLIGARKPGNDNTRSFWQRNIANEHHHTVLNNTLSFHPQLLPADCRESSFLACRLRLAARLVNPQPLFRQLATNTLIWRLFCHKARIKGNFRNMNCRRPLPMASQLLALQLLPPLAQ